MTERSRLPANEMVAGALALAGLTMVEALWTPGIPNPPGSGAALVLGTLGGLVAGLVWRLPPRGARAIWITIGLMGGLWVATALGAWDRLDGKDAGLAWATAVAAPLGGVVFGLGLALAPGWFERRPVRLAMIAMPVCAVLVAADLWLFPTTYAPFHTALQASAWVALALAVRAWLDRPVALWRAGGLIAAGLGLLAVDAMDDASIDRATALARPFAGFSIEALRALGDVDRDGHSHLIGGGDCAPFDSAVHPSAIEVPGNGIDDNCMGGDGEASIAADPTAVAVPDSPSPVSVVLITIDALRPDRMGIYGGDRPTTPRIDAFFPGVEMRHDGTYTSGGFTSIAVPSMMRGMRPRRIRWTPVVQTNRLRLFRADDAPALAEGERRVYTYGLPIDDPHRPLAWWLARRGMATAAVVDDGPSRFLEARWGTGEGFERFVEIPDGADGDRATANAALAEFESLSTGGPFFLWTHFYGPHLPDQPHDGIPQFGDDPLARYDHEIAFADNQVGRLLDAIEASGRPTVVIVTSDHGEMVWGPGRMRSHGRIIHPHAIRVPLLVRALGTTQPTLDRGVRSTVDIMPTVMALTETPMPGDRDGVDLRVPRKKPVITETWFWQADGSPGLDLVAALDNETLMLVDRLRNVAAVYDRRDTRVPPINRAGDHRPDHLIEAIADHVEISGGPPRLVGREVGQ